MKNFPTPWFLRYDRQDLPKDLFASLVVFLVALPLCMGIAIASGVPPALGLITGIVGGLVAITAAFIPLGELADATSIGTLFAFCLVNIAVIYLRFKRPDLDRSFKVPFGPVVPALGALACAFLMVNLGGRTWIVFAAWMAVGAVVYFTYSRRHSVVGQLSETDYQTTL